MSITYKKLLETTDTGDIILFNSRKYWYSRWIESVLHSKFSHIGIIIKNPSFIDEKLTDGTYLFESSYEGIPDSIDHKKIYGVQLNPLKKCLHNYFDKSDSGTIYYRKNKCHKTKFFFQQFSEYCNKIYDKPYDLLPQDWIKAEFNIELGNIHREDKFWCSALVSYIYAKVGLLDRNIPWTIIAPNRFSFYEGNQLDFKCDLEPEIEILLPDDDSKSNS
jgi:hypothetical protein